MKHLTPEEFVDLVDGVLSTERARHVEDCPSCQDRASELRTTMTGAKQIEVPEPSPLFWDHLSARVKDVVAAEPAVAAGWRLGRRGWIVAAAATAAVVLAVTVSRVVRSPEYRDALNRTVTGDETSARPDGLGGLPSSEQRDDEPAWELLLAMTDGVEWSDSVPSELITDRGAIERAFFRMSVDERQEFARLLEAELAGGSKSL